MIQAIATLVAGATAYALFSSYINDFINIVVSIFNMIPQPFGGILIGFIATFATIMVAKLTGVLK